MSERNDRHYFWAIKSIGGEILDLKKMEPHKIGKPGSPYSISILKIASILRGAGKDLIPEQVFSSITDATKHLFIKEREARRIFERALRNAKPRYPAN